MSWIRNREFKGWNPFSTAKRVAKGDRRIAKQVRKIIGAIQPLKDNIHKDFLARNSKEFEKHVEGLYSNVKIEAAGLEALEEDALRQNYELLVRIRRIVDEIKKIRSETPDKEINEALQLINAKEHQIADILGKEKGETLILARDIHKVLGFNTINDLEGLANQIRKREKQIRKDIKSSSKEEKVLERDMALFEKMDVKQRHSREVSFLKVLRDFLEKEVSEASHIYTISHDGAMLIMSVMKDLRELDEIIKTVAATGLSPEWCRENAGKVSQIHEDIKKNLVGLYNRSEDVYKISHQEAYGY